MAEFSTDDFKNWLAWSIMGTKTVWAVLVEQYKDPEKCLRAWYQFKYWAYTVTGNEMLNPPQASEKKHVAAT